MMKELDQVISELRKKSHYQKADYARMAETLGEEYLLTRLKKQLNLYERQAVPHRKFFRTMYRKLILTGLVCSGQLGKSRRLARKPEWVEQEWGFGNLPAAFDGTRILQLTDFHFDFIPDLAAILKEHLHGKVFDCCVLTGDFRGETTGPYEESVEQLAQIRDLLGDKVFAVLGNHDNVELMLKLPDMGIRLLMNEAVELEKAGEKIRLAGIDDPHFYKTHCLKFLHSNPEPFTLLLSHSPESWEEAAKAGVDLQLSGHTHGGQICLPGRIPLVSHVHGCPRAMIQGRWKAGSLYGYTSRGVGSSSLDLRLNCPPEITLHTLKRYCDSP